MKTKCNLFVNKYGGIRLTKGLGKARANEIRVSVTIEAPDALFSEPSGSVEIVIPDHPNRSTAIKTTYEMPDES